MQHRTAGVKWPASLCSEKTCYDLLCDATLCLATLDSVRLCCAMICYILQLWSRASCHKERYCASTEHAKTPSVHIYFWSTLLVHSGSSCGASQPCARGTHPAHEAFRSPAARLHPKTCWPFLCPHPKPLQFDVQAGDAPCEHAASCPGRSVCNSAWLGSVRQAQEFNNTEPKAFASMCTTLKPFAEIGFRIEAHITSVYL